MFANQTSRVYCDAEDLEGGLNVLRRRMADAADPKTRWAYAGASMAIECMMLHRLNTQADFFAVFDRFLADTIDNYEKGKQDAIQAQLDAR